MTVFQVNGVHYTSKRSDIEIMDRLNVPTKMDQNYGRSFLLASYSYFWEAVANEANKVADGHATPKFWVLVNYLVYCRQMERMGIGIISVKIGKISES